MGKRILGIRVIFVALLILFTVTLLTGCGVGQSTYDSLLEQYNELLSEKNDLQAELEAIKAVYPPGEFNSLTELEIWASENVQPDTPYLETTFRSALTVQEIGLNDGYVISVIYDDDDTEPGTGWIYNGALANGNLYVWDPEMGEVYYWYSDFLTR